MPLDREIREYARNAMGDELALFVYEDEVEDIHEYGVSWPELCGYFSVSLKCKTEHEARQLFKSLQAVFDYDVS